MNELHAGHTNPLPSSAELQAHEVVHLVTTTSTMDEAHARAGRGAPAGTLIVADEQTAGRGRGGNSWQSELAAGVWLTLIERPTDAAAVDVLSIRLGLAIANAVQEFTGERIQVKWPNDLYVDTRKLAGVLVEARWREGVLDWVAIGVGLNLRAPRSNSYAGGLRDGITRNDVVLRLVPALRDAASQLGSLTTAEQQQWAERDIAVGRVVVAPVAGTVLGIECNGALRVRDQAGVIHDLRTGSLVFAEPELIFGLTKEALHPNCAELP